METFESLEDAMAWADELAADGRDIENSIPDETTPDTEEKQEIGPDPVENIIRLDNVLKTMPDKLAEAKDRLETLTNQLESAKIEVTKPFQQEEELAEKLKRLAELNALLNMDEKGTDALILEDDEQPAIVNSDMAVTPITSVKTKPMLKKKWLDYAYKKMGRISMEITEIECKILRIKAGAILILGMQLGSELQLDTEENERMF